MFQDAAKVVHVFHQQIRNIKLATPSKQSKGKQAVSVLEPLLCSCFAKRLTRKASSSGVEGGASSNSHPSDLSYIGYTHWRVGKIIR